VAGARFPRAARILKPQDFTRLRRTARRVGSCRHFSAEAAPGTGEGARLGLAVSRRVSTSAVRRNRIKRIARDSFRKVRASLPCVDILLIARASADAQTNAILRADLEALWQRLVTLNGSEPTGTMRA
jgi:ribonuclease P protein component